MNNLVIKKPIISEKSFSLAGAGVYVFLVTNSANKKIVAEQVHQMYKVDVQEVRIINIPGKVKRVGKRFGKRGDIKKALVKLKKGQKILLFEEEKKDDKNNKKEADSHKSTPQIEIDKSKSVS